MKRHDVQRHINQRPLLTGRRQGGAAMIIVIAMTGMLAFLGFFFFSFIAAERNSAFWFSMAPNREVVENDYFDFALQQVLIGPPDELQYSALYGRKYSIIPNMLGSFGPDLKPLDRHPFNGRGITVLYADRFGSGSPDMVDLNTDGIPDLNNVNFGFDYDGRVDPITGSLVDDIDGDGIVLDPNSITGQSDNDDIVINFSPAANPVGTNLFPLTPLGQTNHPNFVSDYEPDAGYTYPDINSMFLGYFTMVDIDTNPSDDVVDLRRVWIPSFHRPQYLPRHEGVSGTLTDIYTDASYANRVLRPHREHRVLLKQFDNLTGQANVVSRNRFVAANGFDSTYTGVTGPTDDFPFPDFAANEYHAGIWTHGEAGHNGPGGTGLRYDVDADGLSINGDEAILMDLDHGVELYDDGSGQLKRRIPMYGITIVDADGLINLNTAGNLLGETTSLTHTRTEPANVGDDPFGDHHFASISNNGLSPGEINPSRGFYRPLPTASASTTIPDSTYYYDEMFIFDAVAMGTPQVTQLDMSNMELARLLIGVADGNPGTTDELVAGRWGEVELLEAAVSATSGDPPAPGLPRQAWTSVRFPLPGISQVDEDNDYLVGAGKIRIANTVREDPVFGPLGITVPSVVHPFDEFGASVDHFPQVNVSPGTNQFSISSHTARPNANNIMLPDDSTGVYSDISSGSTEYGKFRLARLTFDTDGNPSKWPAYSSKQEIQIPGSSSALADLQNMYDATGVLPYSQTYTAYSTDGPLDLSGSYGALQAKTFNGNENLYLVDEAGEMLVEPAFRNLDVDGALPVGENMFLHLSDLDWNNSDFESRLEKLVRFNLSRVSGEDYDLAVTTYDDGDVLRNQFTTESYDRLEFAFAPAVGADFSENPIPIHSDGNYATSNYSLSRGWEFNAVNGDRTKLVFPPEFNGAKRFTINDPFREEVRQWLTIELFRDRDYTNFDLPQQRLNINRILDRNIQGLRWRHLTPHPVFQTGDTDATNVFDRVYGADVSVVRMYNAGNPVPDDLIFENMSNNRFVQEWWARYDRQRLARDIYVLLYTLGSGTDQADPTFLEGNRVGATAEEPYPVITGVTDREDIDNDGTPDGDGINDELQAMAQFAVNYVDALDRDGVISEFVYDTNLADGWDITGQKVTATGDFVDATGETQSVFGVEAQQLTFSETYWINIGAETMDEPAKTRWDDTVAIQFLHLELRNASPFDVATNDNTWRIRRIIGIDDNDPSQTPDRDPNPSESDDPTIVFSRAADDEIRAGANFWVLMHDGAAFSTDDNALLYHDDNTDGTIDANEVISPSFTESSYSGALSDPVHFLDVNANSADINTSQGDDADTFLSGAATDTEFEIVLERRANMNSLSLPDNDPINTRADINPWVRVDYMQVVRDSSNVDLLDNTTTQDVNANAFQDQYSRERSEPFDRFARDSVNSNTHPQESAPYRNHSLGPDPNNPSVINNDPLQPYVEENSNCPEVNMVPSFTIWQPHFDRDFVSIFELLSIPIVGPHEITHALAEDGAMSGKNTAFTKFAIPEPGTSNTTDRHLDNNRWYRILGLLEVPTGAQQALMNREFPLQNTLINQRVPGRINLNTIRHPGVLAALIDDDFHLQGFRSPLQVISDSDAVKSGYPYLQLQEPSSREPVRNWYHQFLFSRDRRDPYTGQVLPGIPGSRPFRPLSYAYLSLDYGAASAMFPQNNNDADAAVEHTILRSLPIYDDHSGETDVDGNPYVAGPVGENTTRTGVPGIEDTANTWGTAARNVTDADIETGIDEALGRRRLFEARTFRDQNGLYSSGNLLSSTQDNAIDFHTRHRLLNKIANNSTVRSNVFYCWIHVQFHEAAEDAFGNVQIGGQLDPTDHPIQRAFFVIDRSKLEEAWDPRTQSFDWRKFILMRKILD